MDRKLFFTILVLILLAGVSLLLYQLIEPFVPALLWAGVLVTVTYPLYTRVLERVQKPQVAAALMCVGLSLGVLLPLTLVLLIMIGDLREGSENLTHFLRSIDFEQLKHLQGPLFDNPIMGKLRDLIQRNVDIEHLDLRNAGSQGMQSVSQFVIKRSRGVLGAVGHFAFTLILTELSLFFLFRDGRRFMAFVRRLIPLAPAKKDLIFARTREVIQATIYGSMGTAVVQGLIGGVLFLLLGLPSAVLWAVVMTLSSFLPLAGTSLVWAPAALWFLADGHPVKAVIMVAGGLFISTVDNFIRPVLIRSVSSSDNQLNTLVLFMSVLGGIKVFGFLGIVLGPLLVVLFLTLLELIYTYLGYEFHAIALVEEGPVPPAEQAEMDDEV